MTKMQNCTKHRTAIRSLLTALLVSKTSAKTVALIVPMRALHFDFILICQTSTLTAVSIHHQKSLNEVQKRKILRSRPPRTPPREG